MNVELVDKIVELYKQGKGARLIAKELNMPKTTVQWYLRKANIEMRKYRNSRLTDAEIKEIMAEKYPQFEYMGGYTNAHGKMIIRCKICGYEFEYTAEVIRASRNVNIQCNNCNQLNKLRNDLINRLKKLYAEREKALSQKIDEEVESLQRIANKHKFYLECSECGKMYFSDRSDRKTCSAICSNKRNNRIKEMKRRINMQCNGAIDWDITLEKLIQRDKNKCYICGKECDKEDYLIDANGNFIVGPNYPSIDHVVPISKGGTHTWDNVRLAHHACNTLKSNKVINW